ncbi:MAG: DUF935 family protein [Polyangiales bacterium]
MGLIRDAVAAGFEAAAGWLRTPEMPSRSVREDVAIPAPWQDRDAGVLGNSVTPERMTQIITRRNEGYLRDWVDLADHARRTYPHLHTQLTVRELSVVETEFEIVAGEEGAPTKARRARDACAELHKAWEREGLETWLAEVVGAAYYPAGAHELSWERDGRLFAPVRWSRVAERRLSYACDRYDPDPWAVRIYDEGDPTSPFGGLYGEKLSRFHPDKFLIHEPRVAGQHRAAEGLFSVVGWYWLFGVWSWRDLMRLLEMVGRPPIVGYYSAGGAKADGALTKMNGERNATDKEIAAARAAVLGMSSALRTVLPDTVRLEALRYDIPTTPTQILTQDQVDKLMSKAINGTASATDVVPGSRAAMEVAKRATYPLARRLPPRRAGAHRGVQALRAGEPTCSAPGVRSHGAGQGRGRDRPRRVARGIGLCPQGAFGCLVRGRTASCEIPEPTADEEVLKRPRLPPCTAPRGRRHRAARAAP